LAANLFKFADGGYVPILAGAVIFFLMLTWRTGRSFYRSRVASLSPPFEAFLNELDGKLAARIPGCAVFLAIPSSGVPLVLVHHVARIRVLPELVVLMAMEVTHAPYVADSEMRLEPIGKGFCRLVVQRGFMDVPDVPRALGLAVQRFDLAVDLSRTTYYIGRETFVATSAGRMGALSERVFAFLARNSDSAPAHFLIPPDQVVEIGSQMDL
jgi:KUP system potassium uptake protein